MTEVKLPTMFLEPKESNKIAEMNRIMKMMEEMAGKPKEELGERQPGEQCAYEWKYDENGKRIK